MLAVIGALLVWGVFLRDLPDIHMIEKGGYFTESTVIYDKDGNEIYNFGQSGKRTYVPYELISQPIKDALVSTEDQRFFENPGVDIMGLARAGVNYILGKSSGIQGTSTISQQLIKNTLLTNERSLKRKIQEAYLAYQLNQTYSKEKILEMYLNAIDF
jgi:membrane peptidoglycan carboxypeptidase